MTDANTTEHSVTQDVIDLARDITYVAIGLGVLGYQRLQVHRVELRTGSPSDFSLDQAIDDVAAVSAAASPRASTRWTSWPSRPPSSSRPPCSPSKSGCRRPSAS